MEEGLLGSENVHLTYSSLQEYDVSIISHNLFYFFNLFLHQPTSFFINPLIGLI